MKKSLFIFIRFQHSLFLCIPLMHGIMIGNNNDDDNKNKQCAVSHDCLFNLPILDFQLQSVVKAEAINFNVLHQLCLLTTVVFPGTALVSNACGWLWNEVVKVSIKMAALNVRTWQDSQQHKCKQSEHSNPVLRSEISAYHIHFTLLNNFMLCDNRCWETVKFNSVARRVLSNTVIFRWSILESTFKCEHLKSDEFIDLTHSLTCCRRHFEMYILKQSLPFWFKFHWHLSMMAHWK